MNRKTTDLLNWYLLKPSIYRLGDIYTFLRSIMDNLHEIRKNKSANNFDSPEAESCSNGRRNAELPKLPALFPNCISLPPKLAGKRCIYTDFEVGARHGPYQQADADLSPTLTARRPVPVSHDHVLLSPGSDPVIRLRFRVAVPVPAPTCRSITLHEGWGVTRGRRSRDSADRVRRDRVTIRYVMLR